MFITRFPRPMHRSIVLTGSTAYSFVCIRSLTTAILAGFLGVLLTGAVAVQHGATPAQADSCSWSGTWDAGVFGTLNLTQNGADITGKFTYTGSDGRPATGTVLASVSDTSIPGVTQAVGAWERDNTPRAAGGFIFFMPPDCQSFGGPYSNPGTPLGSWDGTVDGKRASGGTQVSVSATPSPAGQNPLPSIPPELAGLLPGHWCAGPLGDMTLTSSGTSISGNYPNFKGSLSGTIGLTQDSQLLVRGSYRDQYGSGLIYLYLDPATPDQIKGAQGQPGPSGTAGAPPPEWTGRRLISGDTC